jgi:hypothetical protein
MNGWTDKETMTFEEFKASVVRYAYDNTPANLRDVGQDEGEGLLVYADETSYIYFGATGYRLHIGNEEWLSNKLDQLERILYNLWYLHEVAA